MASPENSGKESRFCPYCCMNLFEPSGEEEELVHYEYCGIDIEVKELIS